MKPFPILLLFVTTLLAACASVPIQPTAVPPIASPATDTPPKPAPSVRGVFEGITPCSAATRPLPQIPADSDCEQMIWKIVLRQDPATGTPTTYSLESAYGLSQQNTTGLKGGGTLITLDGSWSIVKGTKTDPDAVVYRLESQNPPAALSLIRVSDDVLHILQDGQSLMVGHAGWSYTLNRTDNRLPLQIVEITGPDPTQPVFPPTPVGVSVFGVFEGRLPCHELMFEFTKIPPHACMKIKSQLTLYQDPATGAPSVYYYRSTTTFRQGTWTIVHASKADPEAVIYELRLDDGQPPVSFLLVDENHLFLLSRDGEPLVGNALFSYTLSRKQP